MRKIQFHFCALTCLALGSASAMATTVLAPGETRVFGGEQVVCSVGTMSTFARAYYTCQPWNVSTALSLSYLDVHVVSDLGQESSHEVTVSSASCDEMVSTLSDHKSSIQGYTEFQICDTGFIGNTPLPSLQTYVITRQGSLSQVKNQRWNGTMESCAAAANVFNAKP